MMRLEDGNWNEYQKGEKKMMEPLMNPDQRGYEEFASDLH
jgi:hypothetical protein